ncbi:DsbA family protein [Paenibacillus tepidiphilus]|uniref:DsbA family protein n=1 Tax=Paenibacillus tepidiphilus TaxID=2608683 RepID=UPI00123BC0D3|nr:DsbA family protein [Paenibacillus tepidiphilus]
MKKKHGFWLAGVVAICVILLAVFTAFMSESNESELEKLPALMDATGKIELTVGDFQLSTQPSIGDPNAPIKVIEFADFKCPACRNWDVSNAAKFKSDYVDTGMVQFYFINFPFLGPDSIEAAVAAEIIYNQNPDSFWEFKEKLFQNQGEEKTIWATEKFLLKFVKDNIQGIDYELFKKDLQEHKYLFDVKKDFKISAANGIYGTPSFVVNGEKVDAAKLTEKIQSLLK